MGGAASYALLHTLLPQLTHMHVNVHKLAPVALGVGALTADAVADVAEASLAYLRTTHCSTYVTSCLRYIIPTLHHTHVHHTVNPPCSTSCTHAAGRGAAVADVEQTAERHA
jgi:hypothetical protein